MSKSEVKMNEVYGEELVEKNKNSANWAKSKSRIIGDINVMDPGFRFRKNTCHMFKIVNFSEVEYVTGHFHGFKQWKDNDVLLTVNECRKLIPSNKSKSKNRSSPNLGQILLRNYSENLMPVSISTFELESSDGKPYYSYQVKPWNEKKIELYEDITAIMGMIGNILTIVAKKHFHENNETFSRITEAIEIGVVSELKGRLIEICRPYFENINMALDLKLGDDDSATIAEEAIYDYYDLVFDEENDLKCGSFKDFLFDQIEKSYIGMEEFENLDSDSITVEKMNEENNENPSILEMIKEEELVKEIRKKTDTDMEEFENLDLDSITVEKIFSYLYCQLLKEKKAEEIKKDLMFQVDKINLIDLKNFIKEINDEINDEIKMEGPMLSIKYNKKGSGDDKEKKYWYHVTPIGKTTEQKERSGEAKIKFRSILKRKINNGEKIRIL